MNYLKKFTFLIVFALTFTILGIRHFFHKRKVISDGVYVLGRRTFLSPGGETGASFKYTFSFNGREYEISFVDPFFKYTQSDSLLFLKIFPNDPGESFIPIKDIKVPRCYSIKNVPKDEWKILPKDTCSIQILK